MRTSLNWCAVFNYVQGQHGVARLPTRDAFERCDKAVATLLAAPDAKSPYRFELRGAGAAERTLFFICPVNDHCQDGQKVQVILRSGGVPGAAPGPVAMAFPGPAPAPMVQA